MGFVESESEVGFMPVVCWGRALREWGGGSGKEKELSKDTEHRCTTVNPVLRMGLWLRTGSVSQRLFLRSWSSGILGQGGSARLRMIPREGCPSEPTPINSQGSGVLGTAAQQKHLGGYWSSYYTSLESEYLTFTKAILENTSVLEACQFCTRSLLSYGENLAEGVVCVPVAHFNVKAKEVKIFIFPSDWSMYSICV